jgi:hypothetical protein
MNEIEITFKLTEEEYSNLEVLSTILDCPVEETARIVTSVGAAYAAQRAEAGIGDTVIKVMMHSLLNVPPPPQGTSVH